MSKFKKYILMPGLSEAAYPGNVGFEEMVKFWQTAGDKDLIKMQNAIENNDWNEFKRLIQKVVGTKLK